MNFPVRAFQLVQRNVQEDFFSYHKRVWEEEFNDALNKIEDIPTRNALFALKNLT